MRLSSLHRRDAVALADLGQVRGAELRTSSVRVLLALGLAALALAWRWYRVMRPRAVTVIAVAPPATTLERALQLLAWAHASGDETLERKTLERVAAELDVEDVEELSRAARELAWSQRVPQDEDVETLAERAREVAE